MRFIALRARARQRDESGFPAGGFGCRLRLIEVHAGVGLMADIRVKRAYRAARVSDGARVLVDRLWPRGLAKDRVRLAAWRKDLAPSSELRKWFGHDPEKWEEFKVRYFKELDENPDAVDELVAGIGDRPTTLIFGAKDEERNNAVALKLYLKERRGIS
ncbi:DUF488 domain-containing protein [Pikeienuella sp. HZG-20]|uniref:DUF488 domain-containing protein n=1 Tax=Paludibacillus litoralis TaxID=3133267 RepID=UPI0030EE589A